MNFEGYFLIQGIRRFTVYRDCKRQMDDLKLDDVNIDQSIDSLTENLDNAQLKLLSSTGKNPYA